nr:DUF4296 domain-containing protein [Hymenobacter nitidus]
MRISICRSFRTSCWKGVRAGEFISAKLRVPPNFARVKKLPICLALILSALLAGCQRPEEAVPPSSLLPKEKMIQLLVEVHLNESRVEGSRMRADSAQALFNQLQKDMFWRHEVSDSAFWQSYRYYAVHEKDLDEMYGIVLDSLAMRKVKMQAMPKQ